MKYRKTFKDAWDETKLQSVNEQEEKQDSDEVKKLKDEIQQWKLKYQQAKIDKSAPVPNPETGEVPLQTGIANALLRAKDKKEADKKETESKSAKIEKLAKESLFQKSLGIIRESDASDKAKGLGLDYMSFGRYGKDGKVTHKNIGGNLTAVDKDEKPIKEPEKGKKADEPKDKGAEVDVDRQQADVRKSAMDFIDKAVDDGEWDVGSPVDKAIDALRDSGQEDMANDLEDIATDLNELKPDAQEKLDDFKDVLKGKRPAVPEAIKKHNVVHDLYKNQQYSKTNFSAFSKDTVNHLKSLTKVLDAGSRTGHPDEPMAPAGLRQDQIAAVQDSMETLKDQLADMNMDTGSVMDDIEFITDPNADHDNYTKGGKVQGAIEDIMKRFTNLNKTKSEPQTTNWKPLSKNHSAARMTVSKDKAEKIKSWLADHGETYPVAIDDNGSGQITIDDDGEDGASYEAGKAIAKKFGVKVLGESKLVDKYNPATKFEEVRLRVEQQNEKENEDKELDIDDVANQSPTKKVKLDKKKTKIEIDPNVDIGQISGGIQTGTGNLH